LNEAFRIIKANDPLDLIFLCGGALAFKTHIGDYATALLPECKHQDFGANGLEGVLFTKTRKTGYDGRGKLVLLFVDEQRCERILARPWNYIDWFRQFAAISLPDLSVTRYMPLEQQFLNVYLMLLLAAFFQYYRINIIFTATWADARSFSFCARGIPAGAPIVVATLGAETNYPGFMAGFRHTIGLVMPPVVYCYHRVFADMKRLATVVPIENSGRQAQREAALRQSPGQLYLCL
jgi:hypothetical protein